MAKQTLTKQDIQKALAQKLHKKLPAAVFVTVFDLLAGLSLLFYLPVLLTGNRLHTSGGIHIHPAAILILCPAVVILFTVFLLKYFYIDLFKIRNGFFTYSAQTLVAKEKKRVSFYHKSEEQNLLHFDSGCIAVESGVFSASDIGDEFLVVTLKGERKPALCYRDTYVTDDI